MLTILVLCEEEKLVSDPSRGLSLINFNEIKESVEEKVEVSDPSRGLSLINFMECDAPRIAVEVSDPSRGLSLIN